MNWLASLFGRRTQRAWVHHGSLCRAKLVPVKNLNGQMICQWLWFGEWQLVDNGTIVLLGLESEERPAAPTVPFKG